MLKPRDSLIGGKKVRGVTDDTINIGSGSVVFDNKWLTYKSINYKISDYIKEVVVSPRIRFFTNRNYAVMLIVGIDNLGTVKTLEGSQVKFSTNDGVPAPQTYDTIPLIGIILKQDGSNDLNAFKAVSNTDLVQFSGMGNIKEKNIVGSQGATGVEVGYTGPEGDSGLIGLTGLVGTTGLYGETGLTGFGSQGATGANGLTGVNWTIHFLFREFI
jgi:hypothetical protein